MLVLLLLLCACSATLAVPTAEYYALEEAEMHFERFMQEHNKHYADENEKQVRFQIFKENLENTNRMNVISNHAVFGITGFMDLTAEEFAGTYTCLRSDLNSYDCADLIDKDVPNVDAPESFDWRDHNAVTRVKEQGDCGSCYAFSSTGNIEGQYAIKHKKLIEVSEQQIVDCDKNSIGCRGGTMQGPFSTLIAVGGIQDEASYPYVAQQQRCKFDPSKVAVKLTGCNGYNLTSQEALKRLVYGVGPIAIAVRSEAFHKYSGGILTEEACRVGEINHAVLMVGYGSENGRPYWIIKNSWGSSYGEDGYLRVERGEGLNPCGMMNDSMGSALVE